MKRRRLAAETFHRRRGRRPAARPVEAAGRLSDMNEGLLDLDSGHRGADHAARVEFMTRTAGRPERHALADAGPRRPRPACRAADAPTLSISTTAPSASSTWKTGCAAPTSTPTTRTAQPKSSNRKIGRIAMASHHDSVRIRDRHRLPDRPTPPDGRRRLSRLRDNYQRGIVDPLAHQLAKTNPRQVEALTVNGKLAEFRRDHRTVSILAPDVVLGALDRVPAPNIFTLGPAATDTDRRDQQPRHQREHLQRLASRPSPSTGTARSPARPCSSRPAPRSPSAALHAGGSCGTAASTVPAPHSCSLERSGGSATSASQRSGAD